MFSFIRKQSSPQHIWRDPTGHSRYGQLPIQSDQHGPLRLKRTASFHPSSSLLWQGPQHAGVPQYSMHPRLTRIAQKLAGFAIGAAAAAPYHVPQRLQSAFIPTC
jgi:hypothetical protein